MKKSALLLLFVFAITLCLSLCSCGSAGGGSGLEFAPYSDGKTCYVKGIGSHTGADLVIPEKSPDGKTVTGIEYLAFQNCTELVSVTIPKTVTSISPYGIFEGCTSLQTITVHSANPEYCSVDGILFSKDMTTLIRYPAARTDSLYAIPDSVKYIDDYAFEGCAALAEVDLPDATTWVEGHAFENCTSLTSIFLPNEVSEVGEHAFDGCTSLTSISVGKQNLRYSAKNGVLYNKKAGAIFRCPIGITGKFTVPSTVYNVTACAFRGCTGLTEISLPEGVTNISEEAFYGCANVTVIKFGGTVEQWNAITKGFDWDTNMGDYTVRCSDGNVTK